MKKYKIQLDNNTSPTDNTLYDLLKVTEKQLSDAKLQQEKICNFLETGVYTVQMFQQRNEKLQEDIDKFTAAIDNIMEKIKNQENKIKNSVQIIPKVQNILDTYDILNPQQKNDLWKEVVDHIDLFAEPKQKDFSIRIYPKL